MAERNRDRWTWRLIHNAICDPAQQLSRGTHTDGELDKLHVWQADAVLSALIDAAVVTTPSARDHQP